MPAHREQEIELKDSCNYYCSHDYGDDGVAEPDDGEDDGQGDKCGQDSEQEVAVAGRGDTFGLMFTLARRGRGNRRTRS